MTLKIARKLLSEGLQQPIIEKHEEDFRCGRKNGFGMHNENHCVEDHVRFL